MGLYEGEPSCPKCGGRVRAPGLFSDSWQCDAHGTVHPLQPVIPPSVEALGVVVHRTQVRVDAVAPAGGLAVHGRDVRR